MHVYAATGYAIRRFNAGTPEMMSEFQGVVSLFICADEQEAFARIDAEVRGLFPEADGWVEYRTQVKEGAGDQVYAALATFYGPDAGDGKEYRDE